MFTLTVDRSRRLLEVRLAGLLTVPEIEELRKAQFAAMQANGFLPRGYLQLVDISDCPIQTQEVYAMFDGLGTDPLILPERLASIVGRSAVRMQARRTVPLFPYELFEQRAEAIAWLFASSAEPWKPSSKAA